jgi:hypothetical protein
MLPATNRYTVLGLWPEFTKEVETRASILYRALHRRLKWCNEPLDKPYREIAKEDGAHPDTVRKTCERHGVKRYNRASGVFDRVKAEQPNVG